MTAMEYDEVPLDLLRLAAGDGGPVELGCALARVLPEHERQIRAKVAAEIEAEADALAARLYKSGSAWVRKGAEIARGES